MHSAHLDDYGAMRAKGMFAGIGTDENKAAESLDGCATSNLCDSVGLWPCKAVHLIDGG